MRRIGIDVGSTHTDAVIMDGKDIIATFKAPTSTDIASGIVTAAKTVLIDSRMPGSSIAAVMIGTTQFTNAVVQRRGLARVAALRVGAQSTSALPPFYDWPLDLEEAVKGHAAMINGGHEFDGKPIRAFDEKAFNAVCDAIVRAGLDSLSVCSMFSSVNPETELWIKQQTTKRRLMQFVSLSSELGGIGIYQRENATLLNAALMPLAASTIQAFRSAFGGTGAVCTTVYQPERRHLDGSGLCHALSGTHDFFRTDQFHAWRCTPYRAYRSHGHRRRGNHQ